MDRDIIGTRFNVGLQIEIDVFYGQVDFDRFGSDFLDDGQQKVSQPETLVELPVDDIIMQKGNFAFFDFQKIMLKMKQIHTGYGCTDFKFFHC
jgi:hypothetical protein